MMKWINVFSVVCILLITQSTIAQTIAQLQKAGDKKMVDAEYYAASLYYTDALKKDEDNAQLWYKLGEATRMFNDYGTAAAAYKQTVKLDKTNELPLASFWAGVMLRSVCTCKNDEAVTYLKKFRSKYKKKDEYSAKAQQELSACAWAAENQTLVDSIKIEHLGKDINTPQSEFNAIHVYPDKIQFSSLRNLSDDKKNPDYKVRLYNQPPNLELMYMPNGADAQLNIGNGAYSPDVKQFYFTQCEAASKGTSRCDVYVSRFENYKWTNAEKLSINVPDATTTQPALGKNEKGETVLFFSSDRAGGEGGLDLWSSQMNADGSLATPVNLGKNYQHTRQ
jgi:tetratricopeptide (TPR) repeat protein